MGGRGSSWKWEQIRAEVLRGNPPCWLRLPGCTGTADTVDHVYPWRDNPALRFELSNCRPACGHCNEARGNTPVPDLAALRARMAGNGQTRRRPPDPPRQRKPRPPALDWFITSTPDTIINSVTAWDRIERQRK